MHAISIITNNVPRDVVEGFELTPREREDFEYIDWKAIEAGEDSALFFRYKGQTYDLSDFARTSAFNSDISKWDGYLSDTFFSGILVRYVDDCERVIVARYYS